MLLLGKEPSAEDMKNGKFGIRVDVFPFNPEKYGNPNHFLSVVKYLFTANEDYREVSDAFFCSIISKIKTKIYLKEKVAT